MILYDYFFPFLTDIFPAAWDRLILRVLESITAAFRCAESKSLEESPADRRALCEHLGGDIYSLKKKKKNKNQGLANQILMFSH